MEVNKCMGCMEDYRGYPCPHCGYDPQRESTISFTLPHETIIAGRYLVGKVLGQGGFGITYIGWDLGLRQKVAIKEYYPSGQVSRMPGTQSLLWSESQQAKYARQGGMEMFLKEAKKMARVENVPGTVRLCHLFQENDTAYIVMDFVEGKTLKSILEKRGAMSWQQAKPIFLSAMESMEQVHEAGIIHRDLSPDNLMITPRGEVKILDLGAAKDLNINTGASSIQVAKSGFSPVEQYTQIGSSGTWTDVYSMAATIYYTLTAKVPLSAIERLDEDYLSWDEPGLLSLPAPALDALKSAMAVHCRRRTQTMTELKQGLFSPPPVIQMKTKTTTKTAFKSLAELIDHPLPQNVEEVRAPVKKESGFLKLTKQNNRGISQMGVSKSLAELIDNPNPQNVSEVRAPWQKMKAASAEENCPTRYPTSQGNTQSSPKSIEELIDNPSFLRR